ncbi:phage virion morphogenesis protein [Hartmannibacter diazotrophicus]|uniref:Phage virion morphogenesis protein n=1 Tax=Hartmannibacter diazotrophicus TaxID=1482074 RepID=A0A2C9D667_9HYPH|nr:phage virion morphogenesis protein [Hartmannibacter diazotrophicus]SON55814.1 phage virion morphogenesis protein [Hartmannibacter diazotrophicus]
MSGIQITVDLRDLDDAIKGLRAFLDVDREELLTTIGSAGVDQTQHRINDEKTAPDGTPWQPNRAGTPTLNASGKHLLKDIAFNADADQVEWGSPWQFAHVHQEGMVIKPRYGHALKFWYVAGGNVNFAVAKQVTIPARPFLGLSNDNVDELLDIVTDAFGMLGGHP